MWISLVLAFWIVQIFRNFSAALFQWTVKTIFSCLQRNWHAYSNLRVLQKILKLNQVQLFVYTQEVGTTTSCKLWTYFQLVIQLAAMNCFLLQKIIVWDCKNCRQLILNWRLTDWAINVSCNMIYCPKDFPVC